MLRSPSEWDIEILMIERYSCVALVTPFMRRVHEQLRESGEVVFVDGTASVDHLNTAVIPFLCTSDARAAPLGVVFALSQDEACLTADTYVLIYNMRLPAAGVTNCYCLCTRSLREGKRACTFYQPTPAPHSRKYTATAGHVACQQSCKMKEI